MKKVFYFIAFIAFSICATAQTPQQISYQAVVRGTNNALLVNTPVSLYLSIVKDSANGTVVYSETYNTTTNANGLITIAIGKGTVVTGTFAAIKWDNGSYFIKTAIDPAGGTNYSIYGTAQLLSVPYALYAANGNPYGSKVGDMLYWNGTKWTLVAAGANGATLTLCNGVPTWGACPIVVSLASLTTTGVSSIGNNTATVSGDISNDGGATITARGICYDTAANPTIAKSTVAVAGNVGTYYAVLPNLLKNTTYYARAYATNSAGTAYGNQLSFTTSNNSSSFTLGQSYGGGTIFYIDSTGQHGLIAANSDQNTFIPWWNGGYITTGALGTAVGTGQLNTAMIISIQSAGSYAATACSQPNNGYSDWFLPSKDELKLMYINLHAKGLGNFSGAYYYSSSEYNANEAWVHDFAQNSQFNYFKNNSARVRACRKF